MKRLTWEIVAVLGGAAAGFIGLLLGTIATSFIHFGALNLDFDTSTSIITAGLIVVLAVVSWRAIRRKVGLTSLSPRIRNALVALYVATWACGVPMALSDLAANEIAEYKRIRAEGDTRVWDSHPRIRFNVAFPVAPCLILTRHEYQLAGLYGWGGWELHAWFIVGTRSIGGMAQWVS